MPRDLIHVSYERDPNNNRLFGDRRWGDLLNIAEGVEAALGNGLVLEGDDRSMHVLNAVCPAFTWALPFSEYVCQRIQQVVP